MKKLLFLSIAIVCIGSIRAEIPEKLKIVVPLGWIENIQGYLDPSLYSLSSSDTLSGEIRIYSPDGIHLSTIFCPYLADSNFLKEALTSSNRIWTRIKRCNSYSEIPKHKI